MAVLVKPNRLFGTANVAAVARFRYVIVYSALMRDTGQKWQDSLAQDPSLAT